MASILSDAVQAQPAPARKPPADRRAVARKPRAAGEPPPCTFHQARAPRPSRPPARTMPDLFLRMGESFARNPAGGFQEFLGELGQLEGPALEGVILTPAEERQIGRGVRED